MKGNGTTELVKALRKLSPAGISAITGVVEQADPLLVRLTGSNLLLDAGDIDVLKHVSPAEGDTLFLLAMVEGQSYVALGVF